MSDRVDSSDTLPPETDARLDALLGRWAAMVTPSPRETEAVRRHIIGIEPDTVPLGFEWWQGFSRRFSEVMRLSTLGLRYLAPEPSISQGRP